MEPGSEQLIMGGAVGAVVGLFLGYWYGRRSAPGSEQARDLEQKLEEARVEQRGFQDRVTEHFAESAAKLNSLTEHYRDVHEHLANSAESLVGDGARAAFVALEAPKDDPPALESSDLVTEPPRDYAVKSSPDSPGVLNERFGLDDEDVPPGSNDSPKS